MNATPRPPGHWHPQSCGCQQCHAWSRYLAAEKKRQAQHHADVATLVALAATVDDRSDDENAALRRLGGTA